MLNNPRRFFMGQVIICSGAIGIIANGVACFWRHKPYLTMTEEQRESMTDEEREDCFRDIIKPPLQ